MYLDWASVAIIATTFGELNAMKPGPDQVTVLFLIPFLVPTVVFKHWPNINLEPYRPKDSVDYDIDTFESEWELCMAFAGVCVCMSTVETKGASLLNIRIRKSPLP
jgi:hypothetical protein